MPRTALHLLELLNQRLLRDVDLVSQARQGLQVVVVAVAAGEEGAAEVLRGMRQEIVVEEVPGVEPPLFRDGVEGQHAICARLGELH